MFAAASMPNIEKLVLPRWCYLSKNSFGFAFSKWKNLKTLIIAHDVPLTETFEFQVVGENCSNLTNLKYLGGLGKETAEEIVRYFKNIKRLSLQCAYVSRPGVLLLITGLQNLAILNVSHCKEFDDETLPLELPSGDVLIVDLEYEKLEKHCFYCYSLFHEEASCPTKPAAVRGSAQATGISQQNTLRSLEEHIRRHDQRRTSSNQSRSSVERSKGNQAVSQWSTNSRPLLSERRPQPAHASHQRYPDREADITVIITKGPRGGSIKFDLLPEPIKTITNPGLALTNLSIQGLHPRCLLANLRTCRRSQNVERLHDVEVTYDQEDLQVKLSEGGSGNKTAPITPGEPSGSGQRVHTSLRLGSPVQVDPKKKQPASSSKTASTAKKAPTKRKAPAKTTIPAKRATRPKIARSPRQSTRLSKQLTARTANPLRKKLCV
ncbi:hypothetical protein DY000_02003060 [Brassica cretica]|uniref:Zinc knuckle CX2CX4HX4C domain-containing protein n=1 Tax=Brassica cretica TaxID=69181 RepID=A0ABQ7CGW9_BRACR|nr:hypothetical protein DY000_02003060 [Brassica cretica]